VWLAYRDGVARPDEQDQQQGPLPQLPRDLEDRSPLHEHLHARSVTPLQPPVLVTHVAVRHDGSSAEDELAIVESLLQATSARPSRHEAGFVVAASASLSLRWERHGEFSVYSLAQPWEGGETADLDDPDLLSRVAVPPGWLTTIPGRTITALQVLVLTTSVDPALAQRVLGPGRLFGSRIRATDAALYGTYRLRPDGTVRFVLGVGPEVSQARVGRIVAGLADIETYRMLALRAFPLARRLQHRISDVESRLSTLTRAIEEGEGGDAELLHRLMELAAEVQTATAGGSGTFSAARAYYGIVRRRIEDLRDSSVGGLTGIFTLLDRRLIPAMATVDSAVTRLATVGDHTAQAADLLRTRVGITTEAQNNELLRSLRAGQRTQLRLQETVEGLSIAAISYYVVGLLGYLVKGLNAAGVPLDTEVATAVAIPVVVVGVWWTLRRIKRHITALD
jgi:uncharacterized membrane-anchored protein